MAAIEHGMTRLRHSATALRDASDASTRLQLLTARERDVLDGLAKGLPNKSIAYDLGISPRTVEIHRANLMTKLEVKSLSEALRIALRPRETAALRNITNTAVGRAQPFNVHQHP